MGFFRTKTSRIDRRLEELHKEMARVDRDLKTVSRAGPVIAATPLGKMAPPHAAGLSPSAPSQLIPAPEVPLGPGVKPPEGDLFAHAANTGMADPVKPVELFPGLPTKSVVQPRAVAPLETHVSRSGREKFAHYFMAGHFQNLRPSRQESRVLRNKAILMLIAVVALLALLFYFLRSH